MRNGTFGTFFKELRGRANLGLREFCLKNGFDPGNISKMERGRLSPPQKPEKLEEYARALNVELDSDEWVRFRDLAFAGQGRIPTDICDDRKVLAKMPLLFRAVRRKPLSREDVEALMRIVRDS